MRDQIVSLFIGMSILPQFSNSYCHSMQLIMSDYSVIIVHHTMVILNRFANRHSVHVLFINPYAFL